MVTRTRSRPLLSVLLAGVAAILLAVLGAPAHADTGEPARAVLEAADLATRAAVATGVDIVQTVTFDRRSSLRTGFTPMVGASVPAGSRLRVHATVNPDSAYYLSVRFLSSGRLIGSAGRTAAGAPLWATVSMISSEAAAHARAAGASDRTALTGITDPDLLREYFLGREPGIVAQDLILPPYSGALDEGWTVVTTSPRADGTTLISGSIRASVPASDGEDRCVRPLVEMVVGPDGVTRSSHWIESCPGRGTREYRAVATYGPQPIQPPTRPRKAASSVLP
jgi:hypothetical protein